MQNMEQYTLMQEQNSNAKHGTVGPNTKMEQ